LKAAVFNIVSFPSACKLFIASLTNSDSLKHESGVKIVNLIAWRKIIYKNKKTDQGRPRPGAMEGRL
jgi:hypothetical protein